MIEIEPQHCGVCITEKFTLKHNTPVERLYYTREDLYRHLTNDHTVGEFAIHYLEELED